MCFCILSNLECNVNLITNETFRLTESLKARMNLNFYHAWQLRFQNWRPMRYIICNKLTKLKILVF